MQDVFRSLSEADNRRLLDQRGARATRAAPRSRSSITFQGLARLGFDMQNGIVSQRVWCRNQRIGVFTVIGIRAGSTQSERTSDWLPLQKSCAQSRSRIKKLDVKQTMVFGGKGSKWDKPTSWDIADLVFLKGVAPLGYRVTDSKPRHAKEDTFGTKFMFLHDPARQDSEPLCI